MIAAIYARKSTDPLYWTLLATFERGLLAALEAVVADLKAPRGDRDAETWLRQRLDGLERRTTAASSFA